MKSKIISKKIKLIDSVFRTFNGRFTHLYEVAEDCNISIEKAYKILTNEKYTKPFTIQNDLKKEKFNPLIPISIFQSLQSKINQLGVFRNVKLNKNSKDKCDILFTEETYFEANQIIFNHRLSKNKAIFKKYSKRNRFLGFHTMIFYCKSEEDFKTRLNKLIKQGKEIHHEQKIRQKLKLKEEKQYQIWCKKEDEKEKLELELVAKWNKRGLIDR